VEWGLHTAASIQDVVSENPIVILPVGSTEQHGSHLPLNTDSRIADALSLEAASRVSEEVPVLVAPLLPFGYSARHHGFQGVINLCTSNLQGIVLDVVDSLRQYQIRKLVVLNGHGGNYASLAAAVAVACAEREMTAVCVNYWEIISSTVSDWRESPMGGIGHAGELETSLMLYLEESYVDRDGLRDEIPRLPSHRYVTEDMYGSGCVTYPALFHHFSSSGVMGDPRTASREKGERIFHLTADALADFLRDFAHWDDWEDGRLDS
jgi:creatinine amidohydrolase